MTQNIPGGNVSKRDPKQDCIVMSAVPCVVRSGVSCKCWSQLLICHINHITFNYQTQILGTACQGLFLVSSVNSTQSSLWNQCIALADTTTFASEDFDLCQYFQKSVRHLHMNTHTHTLTDMFFPLRYGRDFFIFLVIP